MSIDFWGGLRNALGAWHEVQLHALGAIIPDVDEADITVVGNGIGHDTLELEKFLYNGIDPGNSQQDFVNNVLTKAGDRPIRTLTIDNHGDSGLQIISMGKDGAPDDSLYITPGSVDFQQWQRLRGHFAKDGMIQLMGCRVASGEQGPLLLQELAEITGVPVSGSVTITAPLLGKHGTMVTAYPDGHFVIDKSASDAEMDTFGGEEPGPGLSPDLK